MHKAHEPLPESTERVASAIVSAAMAVRRTLGPGPLESAYETCLAQELETRGHTVVRQMVLPAGQARGRVVDALAPVREAQLPTYLRLSGRRLGFLINFNIVLPKQGIKRMIL